MIYCLNPTCAKPENPDNGKFCQRCGQPLTPILRGHYRIIRPLGQGGFGKTYLAEDTDRRNAPCVVKQFAPSFNIASQPSNYQKSLELFDAEAQRLLQLEVHPQIPTLFAHFCENNCFYLVQQFITGTTLKDYVTTKGVFSEAEIREFLNDILPVLDFIHQHQVIHRDIKPDNIIVREMPSHQINVGGKYVLIDFGVAKQISGTVLNQATTVGTAGYAPLEQMRGGPPTPTNDLYSLGVTCLGLLTNCFPDHQGFNQLYNALDGTWQWQNYLPSDVKISAALVNIFSKMLEDYPVRRYQSAQEILVALNVVAPIPTTTPTELSLSTFSFDVITVDNQGKEKNPLEKEAQFFIQNLPNHVKLEMVYIPSGTFQMGASPDEGSKDEYPQHSVTVPAFYIAKYPITQAQWEAVATLPKIELDLDPDRFYFKGKKRPVEKVNWFETVEFCARLAKYSHQDYRLPSESEWEYACRAKTTTPFYFGPTLTSDLANYHTGHTYAQGPKATYRQQTTDVVIFYPNAFGLYDMHGNVWEWCADIWHSDYKNAPSNGSIWLDINYSQQEAIKEYSNKKYADKLKVIRGGSWGSPPFDCRSANRDCQEPGARCHVVGFRVALSVLG